jgi:hypothetical protein
VLPNEICAPITLVHSADQHLTMWLPRVSSVINGSKFPGRFRFWFHPKPDRCNGSYHPKNPVHWKWAGFTTKTGHFNITTLPRIMYFSSDHITIWSVCRLCCPCRSFPYRSQICDPINIRWVAIKTPLMWRNICPFFTAMQWISVGSQIWKREVKE